MAGNNDILPERAASTRKAYEKAFGGLISKAVYDDGVFIFICTEPLRAQYTLEGYQPLVQLERYLKEADGKPVVIFHHAPSVFTYAPRLQATGGGRRPTEFTNTRTAKSNTGPSISNDRIQALLKGR